MQRADMVTLLMFNIIILKISLYPYLTIMEDLWYIRPYCFDLKDLNKLCDKDTIHCVGIQKFENVLYIERLKVN